MVARNMSQQIPHFHVAVELSCSSLVRGSAEFINEELSAALVGMSRPHASQGLRSSQRTRQRRNGKVNNGQVPPAVEHLFRAFDLAPDEWNAADLDAEMSGGSL